MGAGAGRWFPQGELGEGVGGAGRKFQQVAGVGVLLPFTVVGSWRRSQCSRGAGEAGVGTIESLVLDLVTLRCSQDAKWAAGCMGRQHRREALAEDRECGNQQLKGGIYSHGTG